MLGFLVALAGCTTHTNQRLLRIFFTGVEPTNSVPVAVSVIASNNVSAEVAAATDVPVSFLHKPYAEGNCTACHLSAMSQELRAAGGKLCLECHGKLIQKAKYVHAPVAEESCDACHEPHEAPNRFLLARKVAEICMDCHEESDLLKLQAHMGENFSECTRCHDPHGSDRKNLAKGTP